MLAQHVVCSHIRSHAEATAEEKNKRPTAQHASQLPPISHLESIKMGHLWHGDMKEVYGGPPELYVYVYK